MARLMIRCPSFQPWKLDLDFVDTNMFGALDTGSSDLCANLSGPGRMPQCGNIRLETKPTKVMGRFPIIFFDHDACAVSNCCSHVLVPNIIELKHWRCGWKGIDCHSKNYSGMTSRGLGIERG